CCAFSVPAEYHWRSRLLFQPLPPVSCPHFDPSMGEPSAPLNSSFHTRCQPGGSGMDGGPASGGLGAPPPASGFVAGGVGVVAPASCAGGSGEVDGDEADGAAGVVPAGTRGPSAEEHATAAGAMTKS